VLSPSVAGLDADKGSAAAAGTDGGARASGRELSQAQMYQGMAGRMEIISPGDVTLAKFLGSGGYGEARRPPVAPSTALPRPCRPDCGALLRGGQLPNTELGGGSGCRRACPARHAVGEAVRPGRRAGALQHRRAGVAQGGAGARSQRVAGAG